MKYIISFVITGLFICSSIVAQESIERSPSHRETVLSNNAINDLESTEWSRVVYRTISDSLDTNSPMFSRVQPNSGQINLFSLMFNLLKEDKIKAYRFDLAKSENLEEITLSQVLDLYTIPYTASGRRVSVSADNVPSNEVVSYYIKERWYFDSKTGSGGTKIEAICPVIHRQENLDAKDSPVLKNPLFWISFDDLRPYLVRAKISTNSFGDLSKARTSSLYDYIACRYYKGDIYQIGNRNLYEFYTTPAELKVEQLRLEKQLSEVLSRFKQLK